MLQIGEFSKICQVSVKTLHHYDKIGLLAPAEVDRFTGYRYYCIEQIDRMNYIQRLKRYGFGRDTAPDCHFGSKGAHSQASSAEGKAESRAAGNGHDPERAPDTYFRI